MRRKEAMNPHERTDCRSEHWVTLASSGFRYPDHSSDHFKEMVEEKEFVQWYRGIVMEIWILKVEGDPHFPKWSFAGILEDLLMTFPKHDVGITNMPPCDQVAPQPLIPNSLFLELMPWKLEMRWHMSSLPCPKVLHTCMNTYIIQVSIHMNEGQVLRFSPSLSYV